MEQLHERLPEPEPMDLEEEASAYAAADFSEVNEAFVERLVELAPGSPVLTALDMGTGPADIPVRLARHKPHWSIAALDVSLAMLRLGHDALRASDAPPPITLVQSDGKVLPFADDAFDVIFSNSILHHITGTAQLWSEVRRVAKPQALVFFRDLMRPATKSAAHAIVSLYAATESQLLQEEYYRSLLSAYTVEEVTLQLRQAGLDTLNVAAVTDRHLDIFGTVLK